MPIFGALTILNRAKAVKLRMNWADWIIVGILAVSSLISIRRGFVKEALSLVTWVLAIGIALIYSDRLAVLLNDTIQTPSLRQAAAFGLLFAGSLIVGAMVNYLIGELVRMTGLSGTDRLFGMIFGLARGAIVVMAALIFVPSLLPVAQDTWWQTSVLIPQFLSFEDWSRQAVSDLTERVLHYTQLLTN